MGFFANFVLVVLGFAAILGGLWIINEIVDEFLWWRFSRKVLGLPLSYTDFRRFLAGHRSGKPDRAREVLAKYRSAAKPALQ